MFSFFACSFGDNSPADPCTKSSRDIANANFMENTTTTSVPFAIHEETPVQSKSENINIPNRNPSPRQTGPAATINNIMSMPLNAKDLLSLITDLEKIIGDFKKQISVLSSLLDGEHCPRWHKKDLMKIKKELATILDNAIQKLLDKLKEKINILEKKSDTLPDDILTINVKLLEINTVSTTSNAASLQDFLDDFVEFKPILNAVASISTKTLFKKEEIIRKIDSLRQPYLQNIMASSKEEDTEALWQLDMDEESISSTRRLGQKR